MFSVFAGHNLITQWNLSSTKGISKKKSVHSGGHFAF
jgi:hypothetical protein